MTAECKHGGDALQKNVPLLDRQQAGRVHHDLELGIGQAKHEAGVPDFTLRSRTHCCVL